MRLSRVALILAALVGLPARAVGAQEGDSLSVYLLTIGQGDLVWERFGHNAVGIRDARTNTDIVYNWGLFDFESPGFVRRFIRGEMTYWMAGADAASEIAGYVARNRDVVIQELNLTPKQRAALAAFVAWNAREENKYYRYDYFRDNCSTRVRDALDRVLNGAIRQATDTTATSFSYREQALRLMAGDALTATGIDIGLGKPSDRKLSAWEEMFIPMQVRNRLRDLRVPNDSGRLVPLVMAERTIFSARRPTEAIRPPNYGPRFLIGGTVIAALLVVLARAASSGRGTSGARAALTVWSLIVGIVGVLLLFLQTATEHVWAYWNLNTLAYNPLWLLVAVLAPFARHGTPAAIVARVGAAVIVFALLLALVVACVPVVRQDSLQVLWLAAPASLAAAWLTWRLTAARPEARA